EPGRDQVHADGRELEREIFRHGGERGWGSRDEREADRRAAAPGAAYEEQGASPADPAGGVPGAPQRRQEISLPVPARLFDVELSQRRVVGTRARDQYVVDRRGQLVEKPLEAIEVRRVEGGTAQSVELERRVLEALRVAAGEDDVGSLGACSSGCLESDSRAAADHDDGLPRQLRIAAHGVTSAWV